MNLHEGPRQATGMGNSGHKKQCYNGQKFHME